MVGKTILNLKQKLMNYKKQGQATLAANHKLLLQCANLNTQGSIQHKSASHKTVLLTPSLSACTLVAPGEVGTGTSLVEVATFLNGASERAAGIESPSWWHTVQSQFRAVRKLCAKTHRSTVRQGVLFAVQSCNMAQSAGEMRHTQAQDDRSGWPPASC